MSNPLIRLPLAFLHRMGLVMSSRPIVAPDHTESARARSSREFRALVTNTIRFAVWAGIWTIAFGSIGLLISWGHKRDAAVAITTVAGLVGFGCAFAVPFCWLWITAAAPQRDEARTALAKCSEPPTRDVVVEIGQRAIPLSLAPKESGGGRFFWVHDVLIANRTSRTVSLVPSLAVDLYNGGSHLVIDQMGFNLVPDGFSSVDQLLRGPIKIEADDAVRGDLGFPLPGADEEFWFPGDRFYEAVGDVSAYLVFRDLISDLTFAYDASERSANGPAKAADLGELQERRRAIRKRLSREG